MKLWKVAKFLEEIPSRLPFARHPYRHVISVQEFSQRDVAIYAIWLLAWFFIGVIGVGLHNAAAGLCYLLLGPAAYIFYLYLACTKCPYYGKTCYMGGGQCAKKLFKPRVGDYTLVEDLIVPALWISVSVYPTLFLFYYKDWPTLITLLGVTMGWHVFHKRNICSKCVNVKCALNPRFVGRGGRVQITK